MRSKNTPGAIGGLGRFSWLGYRGPEGDNGWNLGLEGYLEAGYFPCRRHERE